ncbi:MAG: tetratricopeptide repeat protein [Alphaproteobacteria bacterium]|nr:tetratricopeptide repeat protein [Alphaproteobacteria bacterium]
MALASWAGVGALAHRSAQWIHPLAGEQDPRLQLAALTCALALPGALAAGALSHRARLAGLAIALGAWVGADTGPLLPGRLVALAGLAALAGLVLQGHWARRSLSALALTAAAALALGERPWPEQELARGLPMTLRAPDAPDDARRALDGLQATAGGWGPDGAALTYIQGRELELSFLDGVAIPTEGRAADAERMLGHLAVALAGRGERAAVLGDGRGLVTAGLITQRVGEVLVHVPNPDALRAQAAASPRLRETMLHPSIRLQHGPSELTLRGAAPVDVLIEVARTPWLDAQQGLPDPLRLRTRRASLREGGAYVLMLPIIWMDAPSLRAALADFVEAFPMAWAMLPPNGADQLILVGWSGPSAARWERFVQASALGFDALAPLGIRSALDLADRALVGPAGLRALGVGGERRDSVHLWPTLHRRPAMLLSLLLPEVDSPSDLFVSEPDPDRDAKLAARADINRGLLQLLSEAARGDFKEIVAQSRALLEDPAGVRALDPIIEPYLERARALIAQGIEEGPGSEAWSRCLRETESARLLNPMSADVYAMSAKCKLARQDVRGAENDLHKALELETGNLEALLGLTQMHYGRGELTQAEQRLREAVKYNPRSWRALYHLGSLLMELGRLDEADTLLLQAKGFAGDTSGLPVGALAHVQLLKGDPNTALTYAELAVKLDPSSKHLHLRGWAYLEVDQLDQAERDLKAAVYADPDNYLARGDLGRVYARRGEYESAIEAWKAVLAADPGNVQAQENLRRAQERVEGE